MQETKEDVSTLSYIQWVLHEAGYPTDMMSATAHQEHPYEELLVMLGDEAMGELVWPMRLLFAGDVIAGVFAQQGQPPPPPSYSDSLMIMVMLQSPQHLQVTPELRQLLNHFNQLIPLGKFLITPTDGLFLRYALYCHPEDLNPVVVADTLELLGFIATRFFTEIALFLKQKKNLAEIMADYPPPEGLNHG